ncbi:hypothetical protein [Sporosarcina koreensis]|uniref:Lipoprotein n=1 Tax=Sporosarcina koreensis TaxID=334735 RepID=A0ABW0TU01_9BACL
MKRITILFTIAGLLLAGCSLDAKSGSINNDSTKQRVYSNSWDGNTVIVEQRNHDEEYETVNEIIDTAEVEELIKALGNADWQENIKVDIMPPDYRFIWNSFKHNVWVNQNGNRLELIIEGQSNYGSLTENSSEVVFEILTGKKRITETMPRTEENVLKNPPKYIAKNKGELSVQDSDTAYEMCVSALNDYYRAIWNGSDIDLGSYIDNENLKQYTQGKVRSQYDLYGNLDSQVKNITIDDAWEAEFTDDADGGFLYLIIPVHIHKFTGGYGEGVEFLVRNTNGKLVIVDWYAGGKDSYDFMVRGENQTIDDPNIWNNSEWVEKLHSKQNEFSGSTR